MEKAQIENDEAINCELLSILENFLLNEEHHFKNFEKLLNILSNKESNFKNLLLQTISSKFIVFIRHAESDYNSWKKKSLFNFPFFYKNTEENYDPKITEIGNF